MGFGNRARSAAIAITALAATAGLMFLGNGLMPRWPLMWLAPLPVLVFALRRPVWQAGAVAAGAWLAGGLNLWGYLRMLGAPPVAWFVDFGTAAAVFAAGVLLMRALERRGAVWSAWLALPAVWVTFEYVRNLLWPHGSGACIAYSQLNLLPFLQLASVAGPWGMGFVLLLFPAGLALAIHRWGSARRQAVRILSATIGLVAAVLLFGAARLAIPQPGPQVTVGLIASDGNGGAPVNNPGAPTQRLFQNYAEYARLLIAQGAQVVVMPEDMGVVLDADVAATNAVFQPVADQTGATLVVGVNRIGAAGRHNEARVYTPHEAVRSYYKEHLLPPFETSHFTPGTSRTLFAAPGKAAGQTWAVAICKDLDFTDPARSYGRAGTGLMLAPAWDFHVDGFWHGHIAVMRAVENGFSLVRSARGGLLTVADNRGRIVAETPSHSAAFATLLTHVPAGHSRPLFLLLGDWFGWCAMALVVWVVGRLLLQPKLKTASGSNGTDSRPAGAKSDARRVSRGRHRRRMETRPNGPRRPSPSVPQISEFVVSRFYGQVKEQLVNRTRHIRTSRFFDECLGGDLPSNN
jgi:apolipoprotein N-acyltransferase